MKIKKKHILAQFVVQNTNKKKGAEKPLFQYLRINAIIVPKINIPQETEVFLVRILLE